MIKVAVICGGQSPEHRVSLASGAEILRALNPKKYEIIPMIVGKDGFWHVGQRGWDWLEGREFQNSKEISMTFTPGAFNPLPMAVDVVIPMIHGPSGEDGTLQGLLKFLKIPFVGSDVLASSLGMDKDICRRLAVHEGLDVTRALVIKKEEISNYKDSFEDLCREWGVTSLFVKPCGQGSSVGVSRVSKVEEWWPALEKAGSLDKKILLEEEIYGCELTVGVLGSPPRVSPVGEIRMQSAYSFYSYEAKLDPQGKKLIIPSSFNPELLKKVQEWALKIFQRLEAYGMARVDFFYGDSGRLVFNEINTIPGFTSVSLYGQLMGAMGISLSDLLDELIELAFLRHRCEPFSAL